MKNSNCDNDKCTKAKGVVKVLQNSIGGIAVLCHACFDSEIEWRKNLNKILDDRHPIPRWEHLKSATWRRRGGAKTGWQTHYFMLYSRLNS